MRLKILKPSLNVLLSLKTVSVALERVLIERSLSVLMAAMMVQVTNVSPSTTSQQLKELFSYLGDINEIKLYPEE